MQLGEPYVRHKGMALKQLFAEITIKVINSSYNSDKYYHLSAKSYHELFISYFSNLFLFLLHFKSKMKKYGNQND